MFFYKAIMGLRPIQEHEKDVRPASSLFRKRPLPFVISTGAQRSGEISVLMSLVGNVFRESVGIVLVGKYYPETGAP
jgi:hypothetical protein